MLFFIAQKIILFTFWFVVGVTTYLRSRRKLKINQYSFFELTFIAGNLSKDIEKKSFLYDSLRRSELFNPTGNNALDLLNMIQFFNKLQFFFVFIIIYNSLLLFVNEKALENCLLKFFPTSLVSLYIRSIQYGKKAALVVCICSFILIIISNAYSYYYLDFFIANIEKIVAIWPK